MFEAVVRAACDVFHQVGAVVGEGRHGLMRPPIAIVFARLRRRQRHRLAFVHDQEA